MASVSRNVVLSTLAFWTLLVVRAGQQLLWVPLFLTVFGKEGYGEWLTLIGLAGYASISDLGVHVYWLNLLTGAYVRGEIDNYRRIFRAGLFLFLAVGLTTLAVSGAFSLFHGPSRLLGLEAIRSSIASVAFLVLVGQTLLTVLSQMLRGVFRTVGENPKYVWFGVARESCTFALVAAALLASVGPLGLALVYGGIGIGMAVWVVFTLRGRFAHLVDYRIHRADRKTVTGLVGGGSIRMVSLLANLLLIQGTLIITNWALGAAVVALVATCRTLANVALQAGGSLYQATLPEFSRLEAASDNDAMKKLLRRSSSFVFLLSGLACVGLAALGPWLFDLWTGGRFPNAAPLIYLFAAAIMVDAMRMPLSFFLLGCNRIAWVALTDIAYAVTALAVMWLLFPRLGAWAVPIATMTCGALIHLPSVLAGSGKILPMGFLLRLVARIGLGLVLVALPAVPLGLSFHGGISLPFLLAQTAVGLAAFAALAWLLVLDRADATLLKKRLLGLGRKAAR
ncbi:MAG: lipopolysaccharide biosynthesis protein [Bradymonadales bacterium]|nr:lipopolysaccharide biosynthesis protein [Bradymonadales bacterium]